MREEVEFLDFHEGHLRVAKRTVPSGIEKKIFKALKECFGNPNSSSLHKHLGQNCYSITIYSGDYLNWKNLKKMETTSSCEVKVTHGLYGLSFFFTPQKKMNPSIR